MRRPVWRGRPAARAATLHTPAGCLPRTRSSLPRSRTARATRLPPPVCRQAKEPSARFSPIRSSEEQSVHRVLRLFPARVTKRREKAFELAVLALRHLNADQNRTVVRTLVAILEQADIPVRRHRRLKLHQRARTLPKLE